LQRFLVLIALVLLLNACKNADKDSSPATKTLFTLLPADSTNILFSNPLTEAKNTNILMYEYFYNGAGVAVGDLNGDQLDDIYFTGNMSDNKLYLNRGQFKFEDITEKSGAVNRRIPWRTGVTMADVNGDGRQDIFVSYSGRVQGKNRVPQLFVNDGNDAAGIPHFSDQATAYGLADTCFNTQVYFFDYDRDGDLDAFFLNHNPDNLPVLDENTTKALLTQNSPTIGVRLLQNNNQQFTDITQKAGFSSSVLTYGLGAGIADINSDGWPDIYISNDYNVPDYLYINNRNGTFTDRLQSMMGHTTKSSMGNNVADINNDGWQDIFVLDMLPESNHRQKILFAPDNYEKFEISLRSGFYYQYMRNMLQLNNGDGSFSEIGQLAGISNTDWSWAPLFADYDNDGWKDLFVTNGYTRDFTNLDFLKYMNDYIQTVGRLKRENVLELLTHMPASDVVNYAFKNEGDLHFSNVSKSWGINQPSNSNGAAYADLDNDGDLDLVISNINKPAFIYRNEARQQSSHHYIKLQLKGSDKNTAGIGARIQLFSNGQQQVLEQMPTRGFQSTVSNILHFGLGTVSTIDSLRITWQRGKSQLLLQPKADQLLVLDEKDASPYAPIKPIVQPLLTETKGVIDYASPIVTVNDFKRQPLLLNPLSTGGPCFAQADINGDGLIDIYAGGGSGEPGKIFIRQKEGGYKPLANPAFAADRNSEDAAAVFLDANKDGFADLYVASGGYHHYVPDDSLLLDRLYMNDGKGHFRKATNALPAMTASKGAVASADVNGDGAPDIFVGGRVIPGRYPETPQSYLLINDGKGHFTDQTTQLAPALQQIGMVTDAVWIDLNKDNKPELVVTGEWMPIKVFGIDAGKLKDVSGNYFDKERSGWWNKLGFADLNNDGRPDLVAGNMGLNTQCTASTSKPAELYYKDFDENGSVDPIFCLYIGDSSFPYVTRDELLDQISATRNRFTDYKSYADVTLEKIFTAEELKGAKKLSATDFKTTCFIMNANGKFEPSPLPVQAQYAPVFAINSLDVDKDGFPDLVLGGNINQARLRFGKYDASFGTLLKGNGKGGFTYVPQYKSGLSITGDIRSIVQLDSSTLLFGINQQAARSFKIATR